MAVGDFSVFEGASTGADVNVFTVPASTKYLVTGALVGGTASTTINIKTNHNGTDRLILANASLGSDSLNSVLEGLKGSLFEAGDELIVDNGTNRGAAVLIATVLEVP